MQETPNHLDPKYRTPLPFAPDAQFNLDDFDAQILAKGYEVIIEKNIRCPCASAGNGSPLPSCQSCGGFGFVFVKPVETLAVLQSMAFTHQQMNWTEANMGTARITFLSTEKFTYGDKITHKDAMTIYSEILYPQAYFQGFGAYTIYGIEKIDSIYAFVATNKPLKELIIGKDFSFKEGVNFIQFSEKITQENLTVSIRYYHKPSYMIVDIPRDVMLQKARRQDLTVSKLNFPNLAVAKRLHLLIDTDNSKLGIINNNENGFA